MLLEWGRTIAASGAEAGQSMVEWGSNQNLDGGKHNMHLAYEAPELQLEWRTIKAWMGRREMPLEWRKTRAWMRRLEMHQDSRTRTVAVAVTVDVEFAVAVAVAAAACQRKLHFGHGAQIISEIELGVSVEEGC